jgi:receptor expression-enhancing protein 5/6
MHLFSTKLCRHGIFYDHGIFLPFKSVLLLRQANLILICVFAPSAERFKELEKKAGYSKVYFFLGACILLSGIILLAGGFKLVTDLVGFLYPAYMSFKSMESAKGMPDDATQWLTYWVVFSSLTVFEGVATFIVDYIPFYYVIKIGLIIWLYHPKTTGAELIYNQVVRPFILPYLEMTKTTKKAE